MLQKKYCTKVKGCKMEFGFKDLKKVADWKPKAVTS